jgi:hypothetical protein
MFQWVSHNTEIRRKGAWKTLERDQGFKRYSQSNMLLVRTQRSAGIKPVCIDHVNAVKRGRMNTTLAKKTIIICRTD